MKVQAYTKLIETATVMIKEHGAILINGSIRTCYGPNGELYCLPIYVINPPEKYGSSNAINISGNVKEEKVKVPLI